MEILDLIKVFGEHFDYEEYSLVCSDEEKLIVRALVEKDGRVTKFDYLIYYLETGIRGRINENELSSQDDFYNEIMIGDKLYVVSYEGERTLVTKLGLKDPQMECIYENKLDAHIYVLDEDHLVLLEDRSEMVDDYDEEKDREGDYIFSTLVDLKEGKEYEFRDKKFRLGLNNLEILEMQGRKNLMIEENYYELWDLEDYYLQGFKRSDFVREGYKESINLVDLKSFVESIKFGQEIPYKVLFATEYNENIRYFGKDEANIYMTNKNFDTKLEDIIKCSLENFECEIIGNVDYKGYDEYTDVHYDLDNKKIYYFNDEKLTHLYPSGKTYSILKMDGYRDDILGVVDENMVFQGFYENEDGKGYFDYIRFMNRETSSIYKNVSGKIIGNTLILSSD